MNIDVLLSITVNYKMSLKIQQISEREYSTSLSAKNNGQSPVNDRPVLRLIVCILTSPIIFYNF